MLLLGTASCPTPIVVSEGHLYILERHLLFLKCTRMCVCVCVCVGVCVWERRGKCTGF
jgi:hypothetical protein